MRPLSDVERASFLLEVRSARIAQAVVDEQLRRGAGLDEDEGGPLRRGWLECTEQHLEFIRPAAELGRQEIFDDYVRWRASTLESRTMSRDALHDNLTALRDVLATDDELAPVAGVVAEGLSAVASAPPQPASEMAGDGPLDELARTVLAALVAADRPRAVELIAGASRSGVSRRDIYLHVLAPALREVGRLWQLGRLTPAYEHFATNVAGFAMAAVHPAVTRRDGPTAVVTAVQDEMHEMGARMVADFFEDAGWSPLFLGAGMPHWAVVQMLASQAARVLCASCTMASHLLSAKRLIARVRADGGDGVVVLVGGAAFDAYPGVWRDVGADGWTPDPDAAAPLAAELLGG